VQNKISVTSSEDDYRGKLSIDIIVDGCVVQTITLPTDQLFRYRELIAQASRMQERDPAFGYLLNNIAF
jgi:hypothetical protein